MLAQVTESFSDGDFSNAPAWSGNQNSFIVENEALRLKADPVSGTAFLSTSSNAVQNASWECTVRMNFNPSSTNRSQIYILSDSEDIAGALNGYFVMIGDTPDEISLYRQAGAVKTKIIDGVNGRVNLSTVSTKIKVMRDDVGNWELFSDVGLTGSYVSEGIAFDATWTQGSWFGLLCTYTATRSDDFYFDDFVVSGLPAADIMPPEIEQLNVLSSKSIEIIFSEPLNESTVETVDNFVLTPGSISPKQAILGADERTVLLSFDEHFRNASEYSLVISQVEDVSGNKMTSSEMTFFYFQAVAAIPKDIIITEVFSDPEPSQGLPAIEFIELFNRSEKAFELSDWSITDGSSVGVFPKTYLFPGDYIIVTSSSDVHEFSGLGKTAGVANFPSLNNSGDRLVLKDALGLTIDVVHYSDEWYHDDDKQSGGWSLELIDVNNTCSESSNWIASEDANGGTPAKQNSVFANKPDLTGPSIASVIPVNETTIVVRFNEKLAKTPLSKQQFVIHPENEIADVAFTDSLLTSATISLTQSLGITTTYSLVASEIYDCAGNVIQEEFRQVQFGIPQEPERNDILINELLFNPTSTGVDFVELYNASSKFINGKSLELVNGNGDVSSLSDLDRLIAPGEYIVTTTNRDMIIGEYPGSFNSTFYEMTHMPSMNDDEGFVTLVARDIVIDSMSYSKSMHSPFLKEEEGVSLERISFFEATNVIANWKSASSAAGFATPGFVNSNSRAEFTSDKQVTIEPEAFSPLDSQQDFVLIHYCFDSGGQVANIDILDSHGRVVYNLANNELLGTSGFFRWDGNDASGYKARVGYYMVKFEVFDATGVVRVFKKRLAIASRF